jgi:hypothetical protein
MLISFSDYYSTPKMQATCSSATSVDFQQTTTPRYMPEDRIIYNHCCENHKLCDLMAISQNYTSTVMLHEVHQRQLAGEVQHQAE